MQQTDISNHSLLIGSATSVSALVILAGYEDKDEKPTFVHIVRAQIKTLRKQLDNKPAEFSGQDIELPGSWNAWNQSPQPASRIPEYTRLDSRLANQTRIWGTAADVRTGPVGQMPGELPSPGGQGSDQRAHGERDLKSMANAAAKLGRSFIF